MVDSVTGTTSGVPAATTDQVAQAVDSAAFGEAVTLQLPGAGQTSTVVPDIGQAYRIDTAQVTYAQQGGSLLVQTPQGNILLQDFFVLADTGLPPSLVLADGNSVDAEAITAQIDGFDAAAVAPAAGGGGGGGAGAGASFSAFEISGLGTGLGILDLLGNLDLDFPLPPPTEETGDAAEGSLSALVVSVTSEVDGGESGISGSYDGGFEDLQPNLNLGDTTEVPMQLVINFVPNDNEVIEFLQVSDIPGDWKLMVDGVEQPRQVDGSFLIAGADIDAISLVPPANTDGDITINLTALIRDPDTNSTAVLNGQVEVVVDAVGDKPVIEWQQNDRSEGSFEGVRTLYANEDNATFSHQNYTDGAYATTTVEAAAGQSVTFTWSFLSNEGGSAWGSEFDDAMFVMVDGQLFKLADVTDDSASRDVTDFTFSFIAGTDGPHTVVFIVRNESDTVASSGLTVQGVTVDGVDTDVSWDIAGSGSAAGNSLSLSASGVSEDQFNIQWGQQFESLETGTHSEDHWANHMPIFNTGFVARQDVDLDGSEGLTGIVLSLSGLANADPTLFGVEGEAGQPHFVIDGNVVTDGETISLRATLLDGTETLISATASFAADGTLTLTSFRPLGSDVAPDDFRVRAVDLTNTLDGGQSGGEDGPSYDGPSYDGPLFEGEGQPGPVEPVGLTGAGLQVLMPNGSSDDFTLGATVISTDASTDGSELSADNNVAVTESALNVVIQALADKPVVSLGDSPYDDGTSDNDATDGVDGVVWVKEDGTALVPMSIAPADTDGSETITSVALSGLPEGTTLTIAGVTVVVGDAAELPSGWSLTGAEGEWTLTITGGAEGAPVSQAVLDSMAEGVSISPLADSDDDFDIGVSVGVQDIDTDGTGTDTASFDYTLRVKVDAVADKPLIQFINQFFGEQGDEGGPLFVSPEDGQSFTARPMPEDGLTVDTESGVWQLVPAAGMMVSTQDVDFSESLSSIVLSPNAASLADAVGGVESGSQMRWFDGETMLETGDTVSVLALVTDTGSDNPHPMLVDAYVTVVDGVLTLTFQAGDGQAAINDGLNVQAVIVNPQQLGGFPGGDLSFISAALPENVDEDFTIDITATSIEVELNGEEQDTSDNAASTDAAADYEIGAIADAPLLDVGPADDGEGADDTVRLPEDTVVPLNVSVALADTDGSEALTALRFAGFPTGSVLTVVLSDTETVSITFGAEDNVLPTGWTVTQNENGWVVRMVGDDGGPLDAALLDAVNGGGMSVLPPANSDTDFNVRVTATSSELNPEGDVWVEKANSTDVLHVKLDAVVGVPTIEISVADSYAEGADILPQITYSVGDPTDTNEIHTLYVEVPAHWTLVEGDGWTLVASGDYAGYAMKVVPSVSGPTTIDGPTLTRPEGDQDMSLDADLTVVIVSHETPVADWNKTHNDVASAGDTAHADILPVVDAPDVSFGSGEGGQTAVKVVEDHWVSLNIALGTTDADGSEAITNVDLSGFAVGTVVRYGTGDDAVELTIGATDQVLTMTAGDAATVQILPPRDSDADMAISLKVTVVDTDEDAGTAEDDGTDSHTFSYSIPVEVDAEADPATDVAMTGPDTVAERATFSLTAAATFTGDFANVSDGSEQHFMLVSIPALLADGVTDAGGGQVVELSAEFLAKLATLASGAGITLPTIAPGTYVLYTVSDGELIANGGDVSRTIDFTAPEVSETQTVGLQVYGGTIDAVSGGDALAALQALLIAGDVDAVDAATQALIDVFLNGPNGAEESYANNVTLTPITGEAGADPFSLTIDAVPDPINDGMTVVEGAAAQTSDASIFANDTDTGDGNLTITGINTGVASGVVGDVLTTPLGGTIEFHADGTFTYTPPAAVDNTDADPVEETITVTYEDDNGTIASQAVTVGVTDTDPLALDDANCTVEAGSTTGNVIGGIAASAHDVADTLGADATWVSKVSYTGEDGQPHTATLSGPDDEITVDSLHGSLTISGDGSYTYTSDGAVDHNPVPVTLSAGTHSPTTSGAMEAAWSTIGLTAFDLGDSYVNGSGILDLSGATGFVSYNGRGLGVIDTRGTPVAEQINYAPATDTAPAQTQALVLDLHAGAITATFGVSNLYAQDNGSSRTEWGKWEAFDANGVKVGEGDFALTSGNEGSVTVDLGGTAFQYLVLTSLPYNNAGDNAGQTGDSSDYFVRGIEYTVPGDDAEVTDHFTYTLEDADGDTSTAALDICTRDGVPTARWAQGETVEHAPDDAGVLAFVEGDLDFDGGPDGATVTALAAVTNSGGFLKARDMDTDGATIDGTIITTTDGQKVWVEQTDAMTLTGYAGGPLGGKVFELTVDENGHYTYTQFAELDHPEADLTGMEDALRLLFTYTITDADGDIDTARLAILVGDDGLVAADESGQGGQDQDIVFTLDDLMASSTIGADGNVTLGELGAAAHGTVSIGPDGNIVYTPNAGFAGGDSFTYTLIDGDNDTSTGTITVCVTPEAGQPTAVSSQVATEVNAGTPSFIYAIGDYKGCYEGTNNPSVLFQINRATGETDVVMKVAVHGAFSASVEAMSWGEDGNLYAFATKGSHQELLQIDPATGTQVTLTEDVSSVWTGGANVALGAAFGGGALYVVVKNALYTATLDGTHFELTLVASGLPDAIGAIAYKDGMIYVLAKDGSDNTLSTVDLWDGSVSGEVTITGTAVPELEGLTVDIDGELLAVARVQQNSGGSNNLYKITADDAGGYSAGQIDLTLDASDQTGSGFQNVELVNGTAASTDVTVTFTATYGDVTDPTETEYLLLSAPQGVTLPAGLMVAWGDGAVTSALPVVTVLEAGNGFGVPAGSYYILDVPEALLDASATVSGSLSFVGPADLPDTFDMAAFASAVDPVDVAGDCPMVADVAAAGVDAVADYIITSLQGEFDLDINALLHNDNATGGTPLVTGVDGYAALGAGVVSLTAEFARTPTVLDETSIEPGNNDRTNGYRLERGEFGVLPGQAAAAMVLVNGFLNGQYVDAFKIDLKAGETFSTTLHDVVTTDAHFQITLLDSTGHVVATTDIDPLSPTSTLSGLIDTDGTYTVVIENSAHSANTLSYTADLEISLPTYTAADPAEVTSTDNAGMAVVVDTDGVLDGTDGDDIIIGSGANETIIGGHGDDLMTGGGGDDTFVWTAADASDAGQHDTVTDFSDGDIIDLDALFAALGADAHGEVVNTADGAEIAVYGDAGSASPILQVSVNTALDAGDFSYDTADLLAITPPAAPDEL